MIYIYQQSLTNEVEDHFFYFVGEADLEVLDAMELKVLVRQTAHSAYSKSASNVGSCTLHSTRKGVVLSVVCVDKDNHGRLNAFEVISNHRDPNTEDLKKVAVLAANKLGRTLPKNFTEEVNQVLAKTWWKFW